MKRPLEGEGERDGIGERFWIELGRRMRSRKKSWGLKMDQRRIYYGDDASSLGWRPWCFKACCCCGRVRRLLGRVRVPTPRV